MKEYLLQLFRRNLQNPLQAGLVESIEGDSLYEICSKIPLMINNIQQQEHNEELIKLNRMIDNDIPF